DEVRAGSGPRGTGRCQRGPAGLRLEVLQEDLHPAPTRRRPGRPPVPPDRLPGHRAAPPGLGRVARRAGPGLARPGPLHPPEGGRTAARKKGGDALLDATVAAGARLIPGRPRAAIDATGLEVRHASRHYYLRAGKPTRRSGWPKL